MKTNFAAKNYDVLCFTGDGIELWKDNLTFPEAEAEVEHAKAEFGGRYQIVESRENPLLHIPDCQPF